MKSVLLLDQKHQQVTLTTSHKARWFIVHLSRMFESLSKWGKISNSPSILLKQWASTVVDVASRFKAAQPLSSRLFWQRSQRLFRQSISLDHWDGQKFFRLILGMNSWVMSRELTKHDVKIRRGNMTFHRDQGIVGQFNWTLGECLFTFQYIKVE